jgi:hypothetical protein
MNRSKRCWLLRHWASVITRSLPERGARIMGSVLWWRMSKRLVWRVRLERRMRRVLVWLYLRKEGRRGRVILERVEGVAWRICWNCIYRAWMGHIRFMGHVL